MEKLDIHLYSDLQILGTLILNLHIIYFITAIPNINMSLIIWGQTPSPSSPFQVVLLIYSALYSIFKINDPMKTAETFQGLFDADFKSGVINF